MKKIINGKRYDTDTAKVIAEHEEGYVGDLEYYRETLHRKRSGEYFLHGFGHAASRYAENLGEGRWGAGECITPLSYDEARKWAENALDADAYEAEFGVVEDDGTSTTITVRVPSHLKAALDRRCATTGKGQSEVVAELLATLC
jgi:hypothetical protein